MAQQLGVIAAGMITHLEGSEDLSEWQFGFRSQKSTVDEIISLRKKIEEYTDCDEWVIAISLDIRNAFGTIPWKHIRETMRCRVFPKYIYNVIDSCFEMEDGTISTDPMECGVSQGSVLRLLLWNVSTDVLRQKLPPGCGTMCYADDTLIIVSGSIITEAKQRATEVADQVMSYIESLDLAVAEDKTGAILFPPRKTQLPRNVEHCIRIRGTQLLLRDYLKYLV